MSTAEIGEAYLAIRVDFRALDADLRRMRTVVGNALNGVRSSMSRGFGGGMGGMGMGGGILGGVLAATGVYKLADAVRSLSGAFVNVNAELERATLSLGVMLRDAPRAKQLIGEIKEFAARTPFRQDSLIRSVTELVQAGFGAEKSLAMMRDIGDAAAASPMGMEVAVNRITYVLNQMKNLGRLNMQDMMQFANAGIPAVKIMQEEFGKSFQQIQQELKDGQMTMDEVIDGMMRGFRKRYGGMMDQQEKSFYGLVSTIMDRIEIFTQKIGEPFFDLAKKIAKSIKEWLESKEAEAWAETLKAGVAVISKGIEYLVNNPIARWIAAWGGLTAILAGIGVTIGTVIAMLAPLAKPLLIAVGIAAVLAAQLIAVGAAVYAISQTQGFRDIVAWLKRLSLLAWEVGDNISRQLGPVWEMMAAGVKYLWSTFDGFVTVMARGFLQSIGAWIEKAMDFATILAADLPAAMQAFGAAVALLGTKIYATFREQWSEIEAIVVGVWASITEAAKAFFEYTFNAIQVVSNGLMNISMALAARDKKALAFATVNMAAQAQRQLGGAPEDLVTRAVTAGVNAAQQVRNREAQAQAAIKQGMNALGGQIVSLLARATAKRDANRAERRAEVIRGIGMEIAGGIAREGAKAAPIDQQAGEEAAVRRPQFFDLTAWARHAQTALTDNPELKVQKEVAAGVNKVAAAAEEANKMAAEEAAVNRGILEGVRRIGFQ